MMLREMLSEEFFAFSHFRGEIAQHSTTETNIIVEAINLFCFLSVFPHTLALLALDGYP